MSTLQEKMARIRKYEAIAKGEVTLCLHELWDRHAEVPDVPDCYLVTVWSDDITREEAKDPEQDALPPVPYLASKVDALTSAREQRDKEDWGWAWDGEQGDSNRVRFQGNSATICHPVYLTFRWGRGQPMGRTGTRMLSHETIGKWVHICRHCGLHMGPVPRDCPTLRVRALADAVCEKPGSGSEYDVRMHLDAVDVWHRESRPKEKVMCTFPPGPEQGK